MTPTPKSEPTMSAPMSAEKIEELREATKYGAHLGIGGKLLASVLDSHEYLRSELDQMRNAVGDFCLAVWPQAQDLDCSVDELKRAHHDIVAKLERVRSAARAEALEEAGRLAETMIEDARAKGKEVRGIEVITAIRTLIQSPTPGAKETTHD